MAHTSSWKEFKQDPLGSALIQERPSGTAGGTTISKEKPTDVAPSLP